MIAEPPLSHPTKLNPDCNFFFYSKNYNLPLNQNNYHLFTGYTHNPYNGVICNDIILATGVFSSKELWKLSKGTFTSLNFYKSHQPPLIRLKNWLFFLIASILDETNELIQANANSIKMENSTGAYYCNSYPLSAAPGIVSAVTDRAIGSSMVLSSGYSS